MTLNQRLTLINDLVRAERAEAKKRAKTLKALRQSIIDNEYNRVLKDEYGDGPYTINQLFSARYSKMVEQLVPCKSFLTKLKELDNLKMKGGTFKCPI